MTFDQWYETDVSNGASFKEYLDKIVPLVFTDNVDVKIYMRQAWEAALKNNQQ